MSTAASEIESAYEQRRQACAAAEEQCAARDRLLSPLRMLIFLTAGGLFVIGAMQEQGRWWYVAGGMVMAVFMAVITHHENVRRQRHTQRLLRQINEQSLARLRHNWAVLPEVAVEVPQPYRSLTTDLDVFGHASLFHLSCTASTPIGIEMLRDWLLEPASPEEIVSRQQAVAELAGQESLRESFQLEGRLLGDRGQATVRFVQWAEGSTWLAARPWLKWLCRILPLTGLLCLVLTISAAVPAAVGWTCVLAWLGIQLLISIALLSNVHDIFARVNARGGAVSRYLRLFELMYAMPDSTTKLDAIKQDATRHGGGVLLRLRELRWLAELANINQSALLFILVYLPLQLLLLYDFHILNLLEVWQQKYGHCARRWFEALGQFEALASLANLAHDNPDWALPQVSSELDRFKAQELGHPLLASASRTVNDVTVGPSHSFLLVTGSNMSGKSTLLRSIGLNAVLAQAGGPVCAKRLSLPPLAIATSMRIHDSLEYGVSFYMAELLRLKEIVDIAGDPSRRDNRMLLYLLDEILQGTNSKERHIAVMRVIEYLVDHGAIGAVSTHDLELATSQPLASVCVPVHFRETLHDQDARRPMTFDYRLREGVATTTNALKLLELVGLGDKTKQDRNLPNDA